VPFPLLNPVKDCDHPESNRQAVSFNEGMIVVCMTCGLFEPAHHWQEFTMLAVNGK